MPSIDSIRFHLSVFEEVQKNLETQGFSAVKNLWPKETSQSWLDFMKQSNDFQPAKIGRLQEKQVHSFIRRDFIQWLQFTNEVEGLIQTDLSIMKEHLNSFFFLNLKSIEAHWAWYPPNTFYKKHLDVHQNSHFRKISMIHYLNKDWFPKDGGQLNLYSPEDPESILQQIEPTWNTTVFFRSDLFPHEVLISHADRFSLTAWFRNDAL